MIWISAGDGCVRKRKTESAQKAEEYVNRSSPVIEAFKGKAISTTRLNYGYLSKNKFNYDMLTAIRFESWGLKGNLAK